jgi:Flp pilus assembly protein TadD/4-amino-4-deoxy-L-arabinose transferase-like glycosyltransferase
MRPSPRSPEETPARRWWIPALALILLVGAGLRAVYLTELRRDPFFLSPALDAELHDYWARGIAFGEWSVPPDRTDPRIRTTPYFRPPGYPFVLAGIYRLTGGAPAAARIVQFALGLVGALLGFLVARRYAGTAAGVACAGLMATSWNFIFFEGELLDSFLLAVLTPSVILLTRAAGDRAAGWISVVAGASLGTLALVRPNGLALLPVAAGWVYWVRRRKPLATTSWKAAVLLLAGGLLAVLPATLRNRAVSGEWVPISSNAGINLYIGNNPHADGIHAGIPDLESLAGIHGWTCFDYPLVIDGLSREVGRPLGYGEASRIWAGKARRWIVENPGRFAALTLKRLGLFLGPSEIGDRDLDLTRQASTLLRRLPGRFPWYLAGAVVGVGLAAVEFRRRGAPSAGGPEGDRFETAILLTLFATVYVATFLPFFFNARYRIPVIVVLFVFAADAAARFGRLLGERRWGVAGIVGVAFLGLGLAASVDPSGYHADRGEWHYQRGNAFRDARRIPEAVREYRDALLASPQAIDPRRDLALLLRDQGRVDESIDLLRSALAIDPHAAEARFDLAQILAGRGRFDSAAEEFEKVLADSPRHAHAHLSLGTTLLQLRRDAEGMAHYAEAEALAPRDPLVAFVVGRALLARGQRDAGRSRLRRAVELSPDFEAARRALAAAGG